MLSTPPSEGKASLEGSEAHHLRTVLRAEPGCAVELIDGSGRVWRAIVSEVSDQEVKLSSVELLETSLNRSRARLGLIQSLCKADRLEWILEKCTELGVDDIYLLNAARSVIRIPEERLSTKMDRWQKIILSSVKQSQRSTVPVLRPPSSLSSLYQHLPPCLKLLLSENEHDFSLKSAIRPATWHHAVFCVGPEGGWTAQEHLELRQSGFQPVTLGPQILRTETAAVVVAAILKYEHDNLPDK